MMLQLGHTLVDRYRIHSLLAEGASGATYRAWDLRAQREVAVKQYRDARPETVKLFRKEAQQLSQLNIDGVAKFIDHFVVEGEACYLVSEFADGVSLAELLGQYGVLDQRDVVVWMRAACAAVGKLHEKGRLHLDVKPGNFVFRPNSHLTLTDTNLPGLGIPIGTKGYAAPEQQSQRDATPQSDIYSLGATLYTLLTGIVPPDALARETELAPFKPAREVNPNVEPFLSMIAQRAMSLQPDLRYASADDMATALSRPHDIPAIPPETRVEWSANQPVRQSSEQIYTIPARRFVQQRKRRGMERKTIVALASILTILLAAAGVLGYINFNLDEVSAERAALATVTTRSQIAAALTEVAPSPTPVPSPTPSPTPTPAPIVDSKSGVRMVFIPGGTFRMGSDESDESDVQPLHKVKLDPYFIDETEVSNGAYATCVEAGACSSPQNPNATFHSTYYGDEAYDDYPVLYVTWNQSQQFCEWRGGRLPTEAEWEYAAGFKPAIAQKVVFPWGNVMNEANANFCDTNCVDDDRNVEFDDGHRDTAPVGSYAAGVSAFGVYDMAGNVKEWVFDWYGSNYYAESSDINPLGPPDGDAKVIRGGSWISTIDELRVTTRDRFVPEVARANLGFRCAMVAE